MNESDFQAGSIIQGGESVYIKDFEGMWKAFDLVEELTSNEVQEMLVHDGPYAAKFEVLHKPDPADILMDLPPRSIVLGGNGEVATRIVKGWTVTGTDEWFDSVGLMKILGGKFEVVRRGETD